MCFSRQNFQDDDGGGGSFRRRIKIAASVGWSVPRHPFQLVNGSGRLLRRSLGCRYSVTCLLIETLFTLYLETQPLLLPHIEPEIMLFFFSPNHSSTVVVNNLSASETCLCFFFPLGFIFPCLWSVQNVALPQARRNVSVSGAVLGPTALMFLLCSAFSCLFLLRSLCSLSECRPVKRGGRRGDGGV